MKTVVGAIMFLILGMSHFIGIAFYIPTMQPPITPLKLFTGLMLGAICFLLAGVSMGNHD